MKGPKVAILLGIAAVAVGAQNYLYFSEASDTPRAIDEPEDEEFFEDEAPLGAEVLELDVHAVAAWLANRDGRERSPFLTAAEAREFGGLQPMTDDGLALELSGTLWSTGRRVAWINGHPRSEGDWIGETQLQRIDSHSVVLVRDGTRIPLNLDRPAIPDPTNEQATHAN